MNCRVTHYNLIARVVAALCHVFMVYFLCIVNGKGFVGVCWATAFMFFLRGALSYACVRYGGRFPLFSEVNLFTKETVSNLSPILSLDLKAVSMSIWSAWAFDLFTLIASYLGTD